MGTSVAKPAVDPRVLDAIKQAILEEAQRLGVKVERIILFGSRARGEAREESDYDILVVLGAMPHWKTKVKLYGRIHRRLVEALGAPIDLIIVDSSLFHEEARMKPTLAAEVIETGIEIPV